MCCELHVKLCIFIKLDFKVYYKLLEKLLQNVECGLNGEKMLKLCIQKAEHLITITSCIKETFLPSKGGRFILFFS